MLWITVGDSGRQIGQRFCITSPTSIRGNGPNTRRVLHNARKTYHYTGCLPDRTTHKRLAHTNTFGLKDAQIEYVNAG
jgi:hypothetical protein